MGRSPHSVTTARVARAFALLMSGQVKSKRTAAAVVGVSRSSLEPKRLAGRMGEIAAICGTEPGFLGDVDIEGERLGDLILEGVRSAGRVVRDLTPRMAELNARDGAAFSRAMAVIKSAIDMGFLTTEPALGGGSWQHGVAYR